jgi:hypothetical protein
MDGGLTHLEALYYLTDPPPVRLHAVTTLEMSALASVVNTPGTLRAVTGLELASAASIYAHRSLRARTVLELQVIDRYTGPGSGLSVAGGRPASLRDGIDRLRDGDWQRVMMPLAGVDGTTAVLRVKSRTITDDEQTIDPDLVALDDPALAHKLRDGRLPVAMLERSGNLFRRIRRTERGS